MEAWLVIVIVVVVVVVALAIVSHVRHDLLPAMLYLGGGEDGLTMYVQEPWLTDIVEGRKTVEGRVAPPDFWEKKVGETVILKEHYSSDTEHERKIGDVRYYKTLDEYLAAEWQKAAPHAESQEAAREAYLSIMMKSRGPRKDAAPRRAPIQVFGEKRVAHKGGIAAIEFE